MTRWTVPANGRHTSGYGPRNTGIPGASTYHRGHDIAPPRPGQRGVTVHAAGPGLVAGVDTNTYRGRYIRIRHDDRSMTLYQHLDDVDVRFGQRVTTGQRIGLMGSTGVGAGVHLHFECYEAGVNAHVLANAVDPVAYLSRRGVRLVEASTVSRPLPVGGTVPTAPGGAQPDPLTPTRRRLPTMVIIQYGSRYRAISGDRLVGVGKDDVPGFAAAGIPVVQVTEETWDNFRAGFTPEG